MRKTLLTILAAFATMLGLAMVAAPAQATDVATYYAAASARENGSLVVSFDTWLSYTNRRADCGHFDAAGNWQAPKGPKLTDEAPYSRVFTSWGNSLLTGNGFPAHVYVAKPAFAQSGGHALHVQRAWIPNVNGSGCSVWQLLETRY